MGRIPIIIIGLAVSSCLLPAFGAQIHVPADKPTIQQGINAATNIGDTVLVAAGTYNESISFNRDITVISESGPALTIIDAHRTNVVVSISGSTTRNARLDGFTIRNGNGGVSISGGGPTIANNIIITNAACSGAGIYLYFSSPMITNNVIAGNFLAGCTSGSGGGIYVGGASAAEIVHNTITNNFPGTSGDGGGIECFAAGAPIIRENLIGWNSTRTGGGIELVNNSDANITNNVIVGNVATGSGGGIYVLVPSGSRGPTVINNTIAYNVSPTGSGFLSDGFDVNAVYANNIVVAYSNQTAVYIGNFNDPNQPIMRYNDMYSPLGAAFGGLGSSPVGINGNISVDPAFLDTPVGDYHLRAGSPVLDIASSTDAPTNDFDGVLRPYNTIADLGAYEWIPRPPPAPRNFAGLSVNLQTFLTWRASPEATSYQLRRSTTNGGPYTLLQSFAGTNYTDGNVTAGVIYYYVVGASNTFGAGSNALQIAVKAGNLPPVAVNDTITTPEDTPVDIPVLNNDYDPNGDPLSLYAVSQAANGAVSINGAAAHYSPFTNYNGTNSFSYIMTDGRGAYATGQVSVVVTPVNDPPVANGGFVSVTSDSAGVLITFSGTDVEHDPLTFQIATFPTNGILDAVTHIYRPAHGFVGNDPFTFVANDGQTNSAPATITIRVLAQTDANHDGIPDAWAASHGIVNATDDPDMDGMNNLQEYLAGTDPQDSNSVLHVTSLTAVGSGHPTLTWASVGGVRYRVQYCNGRVNGGFTDIKRPVSLEMDPGPNGTPSTMSFTDTNAPAVIGGRFYRVKAVTQ